MLQKILLLLILQICASGYSQKTADNYIAETKALLNTIIPEFFGSSPFAIRQSTLKLNSDDCRLTYQSNKLSKVELQEVLDKIENPSIIYWTNVYFSEYKIIEDEKIREVFQDKVSGWQNFEKIYIPSLAEFSSPIFLRNYEIAIIKFSISSGSLSGHGYEAIFFKRGNEWSMESCSWDD